MTHVLFQDCNKANIKKEMLEEYEYKKCLMGLHSIGAKAPYQEYPRKSTF